MIPVSISIGRIDVKRLTHAVAALILTALHPGYAYACSCAGANLEQRYQGAKNVFTAVITNIEFVECPDRNPTFECTNWEAQFETTRLFKGGTPFDVISSHVGGASCGISLAVGVEYLFFMGDSGKTGLCSGTTSTTGADGNRNEMLVRLEHFTAGRTPDLSSPWHKNEYDGVCTLRTHFSIERGADYPLNGSLHAEYRYAEPEQAGTERGEVGFADVRVWLPVGRDNTASAAQLAIADREFTLDWHDDPRRLRGSFGLRGDAAMAFFEELADPGMIRVTGTTPHVAEIDSDVPTTHAGTAIEEFLACVALGDQH